MTSRSGRLARGFAVAVLATGFAAASHAVAGGGTPSPLALVTGVVFGGMLSTFALSSRPSLPRLSIAVGVTQLAFHAVFSLLGTAPAGTAVAVHDHAAAVVLPGKVHTHVDSPAMWFAHAVAGAVTLALLRGAELAVWRVLVQLARLVVARLRGSLPGIRPLAPRRVVVGDDAPSLPVFRLAVPALSRRGPPARVAF